MLPYKPECVCFVLFGISLCGCLCICLLISPISLCLSAYTTPLFVVCLCLYICLPLSLSVCLSLSPFLTLSLSVCQPPPPPHLPQTNMRVFCVVGCLSLAVCLCVSLLIPPLSLCLSVYLLASLLSLSLSLLSPSPPSLSPPIFDSVLRESVCQPPLPTSPSLPATCVPVLYVYLPFDMARNRRSVCSLPLKRIDYPPVAVCQYMLQCKTLCMCFVLFGVCL